MTTRPRLLIEEWFPMKEVGVECQREGSAAIHPPVQRLHVYWARRPMAVCRAALLGSLLPHDTKEAQFLQWMGIHGDAVAARERILAARETGEQIEGGYGYPRAFTYTPSSEERTEYEILVERLWGSKTPSVIDPMAGGGSIPLESVRLGLPTIANDLNPLAHIVEKATIEYPAKFGSNLVQEIQKYARLVEGRARSRLQECFPIPEGEVVHAYIWARTVTCPHCAATVPLSPNWWLERDKAGNGLASQPVTAGGQIAFKVVEISGGKGSDGFNPADGSIKRGSAKCPACKQYIAPDIVKRQGKTGEMGQQLVALVVKHKGVRSFRAPTAADLAGVERAKALLADQLPTWEAQGLVPDEKRYVGPADRSANYGMTHARDLFAPRQLLAHLVYLEALRAVQGQAQAELGAEMGCAVGVYLAFMLDKCVDYNSSLTHFDGTRNKICNTFDRHDFSIKWSFAEFDSAHQLWPWATSQVLNAYREITSLTSGETGTLSLCTGSASQLSTIQDKSITLVCVDPPYYDNVMYAELTDFFYVWQKRSIGHLFPKLYAPKLTNKDDEAVANPARFKGISKSAKKLAETDYEQKMQAVFTEAQRILRDDGVLTIMFTHKKPQAWDTLAAALMQAGFVITASWPVHTESEHSLHIAKKNAAQSTILLVCRKRHDGAVGVWWEDVRPLISRVVQKNLPLYDAAGINGVDLYLAAFGPALQVLGESWPVRDMEGNLIRPEMALNEARRAVTEHRLSAISRNRALALDPITRFVILAWDAFRAAQFPFNEAHRLSIALGVSVDTLKSRGLVERKGQYVTLLSPAERVEGGNLKLKERQFDYIIDAIHSAMVFYSESGAGAVNRFLEETGLARSRDFADATDAFLRALPVARPEYATLLRMAATVLEGQVDLTGLPAPTAPDADASSDEDEDEEGSEE